jgi:DNA-binding MarR family transcriptional regulator
LHAARIHDYSRAVSIPTSGAPPQTTSGHRLLLALAAIARRLKPRAAGGTLDRGSVFVLHQVASGAPLRVSELAKCMGLDSSTVSRHVSHLEEHGYLSRTGDPDDRRASRVLLTARGRAVLDETLRAQAAVVDRAIADWPEEDREALEALMTRLAASIERLAGEKEENEKETR